MVVVLTLVNALDLPCRTALRVWCYFARHLRSLHRSITQSIILLFSHEHILFWLLIWLLRAWASLFFLGYIIGWVIVRYRYLTWRLVLRNVSSSFLTVALFLSHQISKQVEGLEGNGRPFYPHHVVYSFEKIQARSSFWGSWFRGVFELIGCSKLHLEHLMGSEVGQVASESHRMVHSPHHWRHHAQRWQTSKSLPERKAHSEHFHLKWISLTRLHKDRLLLFCVFSSFVWVRVFRLSL